MREDIKQRWVEALRSGEYRQGDGALRKRGVGAGNEEFCCLGVLCDLLVEQGVGEWLDDLSGTERRTYYKGGDGESDTDSNYLPDVTLEYVGIDPEEKFSTPNRSLSRMPADRMLATMNDDNETFDAIADWIEGNL